MSLLDVIGPVMVGPSSSHTAGACRLALLARFTLRAPPTRAQLTLHGSFAKTGHGHGTHLALAAGLLGLFPDDDRLPNALELAAAQGLDIDFASKDLGDVHPNTVQFDLETGTNEAGSDEVGSDETAEHVTVVGSSLGGGLVKVFSVNAFEIHFSGAYHTLLVEHDDRPGVIASVARVLADDHVNIATLHSARKRRGGKALMSLEIDRPLGGYARDYLSGLPSVSWLRLLPEVMSGDAVKEDIR